MVQIKPRFATNLLHIPSKTIIIIAMVSPSKVSLSSIARAVVGEGFSTSNPQS